MELVRIRTGASKLAAKLIEQLIRVHVVRTHRATEAVVLHVKWLVIVIKQVIGAYLIKLDLHLADVCTGEPVARGKTAVFGPAIWPKIEVRLARTYAWR